jgi:hypothetical protein
VRVADTAIFAILRRRRRTVCRGWRAAREHGTSLRSGIGVAAATGGGGGKSWQWRQESDSVMAAWHQKRGVASTWRKYAMAAAAAIAGSAM